MRISALLHFDRPPARRTSPPPRQAPRRTRLLRRTQLAGGHLVTGQFLYRRRELLFALATGVMGARAARAQQKAMPVIGFLLSGSSSDFGSRLVAFRQGLNEIGYVEGQTVVFEYRWAEGRYDRLPHLAADLVDHRVNVVVAGASPAALAAMGATPTIPIV